MEIEADVKLDARSLNRFLIYHNYMRVSGIIGLVLSLAAIVALCLKWGIWTTTQRCLLVVLALLFTVLQPLMLVSKGKKQLAMEEFQIPFHYCFHDGGVTISQKDQSQSFAWEEIRKTVFRRDALYVYMSTVSAFVIPREQCGGRFDELVRLIKDRTRPGSKGRKE